MPNNIEVTIHPSSLLKKASPDLYQPITKLQLTLLMRSRLEMINFLQRYKLSPETEKSYQELIPTIKEGLIRSYSSAGIDINQEELPSLILIPKEKKAQLEADLKNNLTLLQDLAGFYDPFTHTSIVFVKGEEPSLDDVTNIYHELHHGLGKTNIISSLDSKSKPVIFLGRYGLATEIVNGTTRGLAIEEGFIEYESIKFATEINEPQIVKVRTKFLEWAKNNLDETLLDGVSRSPHEDRIICSLGLSSRATKEYGAAWNLIFKLLTSANQISPEYAQQIKKELFKARRTGYDMNKLIALIDEKFGKSTTKKMFSTPFNADKLYQLIETFKQKK